MPWPQLIAALTVVALYFIHSRKAAIVAHSPAAVERERQQGLVAQLQVAGAMPSAETREDAIAAIARFHGLDEDALQVARELSR